MTRRLALLTVEFSVQDSSDLKNDKTGTLLSPLDRRIPPTHDPTAQGGQDCVADDCSALENGARPNGQLVTYSLPFVDSAPNGRVCDLLVLPHAVAAAWCTISAGSAGRHIPFEVTYSLYCSSNKPSCIQVWLITTLIRIGVLYREHRVTNTETESRKES